MILWIILTIWEKEVNVFVIFSVVSLNMSLGGYLGIFFRGYDLFSLLHIEMPVRLLHMSIFDNLHPPNLLKPSIRIQTLFTTISTSNPLVFVFIASIFIQPAVSWHLSSISDILLDVTGLKVALLSFKAKNMLQLIQLDNIRDLDAGLFSCMAFPEKQTLSLFCRLHSCVWSFFLYLWISITLFLIRLLFLLRLKFKLLDKRMEQLFLYLTVLNAFKQRLIFQSHHYFWCISAYL